MHQLAFEFPPLQPAEGSSPSAEAPWRRVDAPSRRAPSLSRTADVRWTAAESHAVTGIRHRTRTAPAGGADPDASVATVPLVTGTSGDAKLAVRRFVRMCVEVLNGYRPAAHLRRLALPKEASAVIAEAVAGTSRVAELRRARANRAAEPHHVRTGRVAELRRAWGPRLTDRHERGPGPVGVLRLHICEPRPGAVEVAVLLVTGGRTWAMALRLELHQHIWWATTLRLV